LRGNRYRCSHHDAHRHKGKRPDRKQLIDLQPAALAV
jgi:hypothetical protein